MFYSCYKPKTKIISQSQLININQIPIPTIDSIILSEPTTYNDLNSKTITELNNVIILLKTKNYKDGITSAEYRYLMLSKHICDQKLQKLPKAYGVCNNDIFITDDMLIEQ